METHDSATLTLAPLGPALPSFRPGQFNMLYARGIGEIAVSISGDPTDRSGELVHTVRNVGAVSRALHDAGPGTVIGVRGPFGTDWGLDSCAGRDMLIVAGGLGLAPLRPAIYGALTDRDRFRRIVLVVGARNPTEILFRRQLESWGVSDDLDVELTIDQPTPGWTGSVGFVTETLRSLALEPDCTTALLCGPEPMLRFAAQVLASKGIAVDHIRLSLERNMQCGVGQCGHCQLGELLLCRDGPVVHYGVAEPLLRVREL